MNPRRFFHAISYLQYPIVAASFIFYIPFIQSMAAGTPELNLLNQFLVLLGVGVSFSTLQDTTKTQNKMSRKVWENPVAGKVFLIILSITTLGFILSGIYFLMVAKSGALQEVATGITVLGVGLLGILKAGIEMFENHRLDKNPKSE